MLFTKIRLLLKKLNPEIQMELALWFSWFFLSLNTGGVTNILVYSCFESLFESCSASAETFPVDVNRSDSFVKLSIYSSPGPC